MIEWLREQALLWDNIVDPGIEFRAVLAFISYLERTGASPCEDCKCKDAFVLQELRAGRFTETPLRDEEVR